MTSGVGGGSTGQRSAATRAQSQNAAGGTAQPGNGDVEMSQFMQTVQQMSLQQAAMLGSSMISNMKSDDDEG